MAGAAGQQLSSVFLRCYCLVFKHPYKMQHVHVQNIFWQPNNVDYNLAICRTPCLCSDAPTTAWRLRNVEHAICSHQLTAWQGGYQCDPIYFFET